MLMLQEYYITEGEIWGQRIFPVGRPLIKNKPKSVISVMMIIVLFLNLFVKPIERTQTCLKLAKAMTM